MGFLGKCSPLIIGHAKPDSITDDFAEIAVHAVGWIDDLNIKESMGLGYCLEDLKTRIPDPRLCSYAIDPPFEKTEDVLTGRTINWRFSCAGFVLYCYKEGAKINLLDPDHSKFPRIDRNILAQIYDPDRMRMFDRRRQRAGLQGTGPWPIILCGYVLHSLLRSPDQIRSSPHVPSGIEEAAFP